MNDELKRYSLKNLLDECSEIQIPDIQRDYVMGSSGGHLKKLLDSMMQVAQKNTCQFDFSNIIISKENSIINIYDGQQRITTLIVLLSQCEKLSQDEKKMLHKYKFVGREASRVYLDKLIDEGESSDPQDFTSFSMEMLRKTIKGENKEEKTDYKKLLDKDFLFNRVIFNVTEVENKSNAEQFFLDLNDGVVLKDYELFKAKLNDRVEKLREIWSEYGAALQYRNCLEKWSYKMDNEWLYFFKKYLVFWKKEHYLGINDSSSIDYTFLDVKFKTDARNWEEFDEERLEIEFIFYCMQMVTLEANKRELNEVFCDINQLELKDIFRMYNIIEMVIQKEFCRKNLNEENEKIILYSFKAPRGKTREDSYDETTKEPYVDGYRGTYWNMEFENYGLLLQLHIGRLIHEMLLLKEVEKGKKIECYEAVEEKRKKYIYEYSKDIILWAYITHLEDKKSEQLKYMRIIKRLANNNLSENNHAWMCAEVWKFKIYYTKYIVRNMPKYYSAEYYSEYASNKIMGKYQDIETKFFNSSSSKDKKYTKDKIYTKKLFELNKEYDFNTLWERIIKLNKEYDDDKDKICEIENSLIFINKIQLKFWENDFIKFEAKTFGIDICLEENVLVKDIWNKWFEFKNITMYAHIRGNRIWWVEDKENENENGNYRIQLTPRNENCVVIDCLKGATQLNSEEYGDIYVKYSDKCPKRPWGDSYSKKRETFDKKYWFNKED